MGRDTIDTDYLVIGAGPAAMAFVDTLLSEQPAATVVIADRHHRPGGRWNDAYPFMRLHQPSHWYGVASHELGDSGKDSIGWNAGLYGVAGADEVLAYFDRVMRQRFLPSGRVRWLAMTDCQAGGDGTARARSLTTGAVRTVVARRRIVDATRGAAGRRRPAFEVAAGVDCVTPGTLPRLSRPYPAYTVVGAGASATDTVLWMLDHGIAPAAIRWVVPRDAWLYNRANLQPGLENYERSVGQSLAQLDAIVQAASVPDLFERLEAQELLLRLDTRVPPTAFRCAVVSPAELTGLRRIDDVVRLGRVQRVERGRLVLAGGTLRARADTLYVDCTGRKPAASARGPVFDDACIRLRTVRTCQPAFSAALIAWVDSRIDDPIEKNALCEVVPHPDRPIDWLRTWQVSLANSTRWRRHPALSDWLLRCRLNAMAVHLREVARDDARRLALMQAMGPKALAAARRLPSLIAEAGSAAR